MKKWLKRIRGAVGTALTWAVAWGGGGVIAALVGVFGPLGPIADYVLFAGIFAILGFVGGGDVPPGVVPLAMLELDPSVVQEAGAF